MWLYIIMELNFIGSEYEMNNVLLEFSLIIDLVYEYFDMFLLMEEKNYFK